MAIANIFFDLDETLLHTVFKKPKQKHFEFSFGNETQKYYVIIRPCATELIEFARKLVGSERVFILTSSAEDYAKYFGV